MITVILFPSRSSLRIDDYHARVLLYCTRAIYHIGCGAARVSRCPVQFGKKLAELNLQYDTKVRTFKLTVTDGRRHPRVVGEAKLQLGIQIIVTRRSVCQHPVTVYYGTVPVPHIRQFRLFGISMTIIVHGETPLRVAK
jgi:hypothetical protein